MNQSFLFFELIGIFIVHWLILEPQTYVVVEQFGAENIPLLSGRLVQITPTNHVPATLQQQHFINTYTNPEGCHLSNLFHPSKRSQ